MHCSREKFIIFLVICFEIGFWLRFDLMDQLGRFGETLPTVSSFHLVVGPSLQPPYLRLSLQENILDLGGRKWSNRSSKEQRLFYLPFCRLYIRLRFIFWMKAFRSFLFFFFLANFVTKFRKVLLKRFTLASKVNIAC